MKLSEMIRFSTNEPMTPKTRMLIYRTEHYAKLMDEIGGKLEKIVSYPTTLVGTQWLSKVIQIDHQNNEDPENYKLPIIKGDDDKTYMMILKGCFIEGPIDPEIQKTLDLFFKYDKLYYLWHKRMIDSGTSFLEFNRNRQK